MMSITTNWNPTEPRPIIEISVSLSISLLRSILPSKLVFTTESLLEQLLITQYFKRDIFEQIGTLVARGQDPKAELEIPMDVSMVYVLRKLYSNRSTLAEERFYEKVSLALAMQTDYFSRLNDDSNEEKD